MGPGRGHMLNFKQVAVFTFAVAALAPSVARAEGKVDFKKLVFKDKDTFTAFPGKKIYDNADVVKKKRHVRIYAGKCTRKSAYKDTLQMDAKACFVKMECDVTAVVNTIISGDPITIQTDYLKISPVSLGMACLKKGGECPKTEEQCIADATAEAMFDGSAALANDVEKVLKERDEKEKRSAE
jgi:hypothetical protein